MLLSITVSFEAKYTLSNMGDVPCSLHITRCHHNVKGMMT